MRPPLIDYLDEIIQRTTDVTDGELADYIPELASADPEHVAVAICTVNGTVYATGDTDVEFTIQSMSKPFAYALAIEDRGIDFVLGRVGVEPSGDAFNELSLDAETNRPLNPMINAGAIVTHSLIKSDDAPAVDRMIDLFGRMAGRDIEVDDALAESEMQTANRNLGLAYLLKAAGALEIEPHEAVEGYVRQCAANVTVADLAVMAATLANGGVQPSTGERIFSRKTGRQLLSVMATCGMYDAAGDWLTTVGIPAKSGVSGGIFGVLPGEVGIAVFAPRLDVHGNSTRGIEMMRHMSEDFDLHLMEAVRPSRSALRETRIVDADGERATMYVMQGDMTLTSIEALVHEVVKHPADTQTIIFDLSRADEYRKVARMMSAQTATKLIDDGYRVIVVDPDGALDEFSDSNSPTVERWSREQLAACSVLESDEVDATPSE